jgi:hypothetical protein
MSLANSCVIGEFASTASTVAMHSEARGLAAGVGVAVGVGAVAGVGAAAAGVGVAAAGADAGTSGAAAGAEARGVTKNGTTRGPVISGPPPPPPPPPEAAAEAPPPEAAAAPTPEAAAACESFLDDWLSVVNASVAQTRPGASKTLIGGKISHQEVTIAWSGQCRAFWMHTHACPSIINGIACFK